MNHDSDLPTEIHAILQDVARVLPLGPDFAAGPVAVRRLAPGADPARVALDAIRADFGGEGDVARYLGADVIDGVQVLTFVVRVWSRRCA